MVEDKKRALKKFIRNYTLVVLVILGLIITLLFLIWFRFLALVSIGDLSKINPLITSGQNKLVLKDGTSEIVKIPIDNAGSSKGSSDDNAPADTSTGGDPAAKQTNSATVTIGGVTQPSSGGSTGTSSSPSPSVSPSVSPSASPSSSPSPSPSSSPFAASISPNVTYTTSDYSSYFGGCQITYKFTFTVIAANAPGVVKAQWRWPGSTWGNEFNISFTSGQTTATAVIQQFVRAGTSSQVVSLRLNSPNAVQKDYGFTHQC